MRTLHWASRPAEARPAASQPAWEIRPRGTAARVHRVYSIPLADPGVEVQVPVLSLSFSPRSLAVILAAAACAALVFLLTASAFRVESPQIRGVQYLTADSILAASDLTGSNFFLVSPADVESAVLRKIPAVRRVSVTVDFSGEVIVSVQEREPILLWSQDGSAYWVDAEGVFFPALGQRSDLIRLVVPEEGPPIAFDGAADIDAQLVVQVLELTVALPSGTQIIYHAVHGLGMMDPGGWTVYFGSSGRIEQKLEVYRRLMDSLAARGIRPVLVSVENLQQPFYRR